MVGYRTGPCELAYAFYGEGRLHHRKVSGDDDACAACAQGPDLISMPPVQYALGQRHVLAMQALLDIKGTAEVDSVYVHPMT